MILGTAAYMSPEQTRGQAIDKRTDIWGFGCVLYEMFAGRAPFARATVSDTIAAILAHRAGLDGIAGHDATPRSTRNSTMPAQGHRDPAARYANAESDLIEAAAAPESERTIERRTPWLAVTAFAIGSLIVIGAAVWIAQRGVSSDPASPAAEIRLQIPTPPTTDPASLAISPDGRQLAFIATSGGRPMLWLRLLNDVAAKLLAGTEEATFPFWSADGRSIGFFAERLLKRIDLSSGTVRTLARAEGGRGGTWSQDDVIVYQPSGGATALRSISAEGGESRELMAGEGRFPYFLPDGHHFLFSRTYGAADSETRGLYVASIDGRRHKVIKDADSAAVVTGSNHVLFVRGGALFAQRFDVMALAPTGEATPVANDMNVNPPLWLSPIAASRLGVILYRTGSAEAFANSCGSTARARSCREWASRCLVCSVRHFRRTDGRWPCTVVRTATPISGCSTLREE